MVHGALRQACLATRPRCARRNQAQYGGVRDFENGGGFVDGQLAALLALALTVGENATPIAD